MQTLNEIKKKLPDILRDWQNRHKIISNCPAEFVT